MKRMTLAVSFAVLFFLLYLWQNQDFIAKALLQQNLPRSLLAFGQISTAGKSHESLTLVSYIAPWYVAAVKQPVQPSPLRKMITIALNEEGDEFNDSSLVVMDKVVVIPKFLHSKSH